LRAGGGRGPPASPVRLALLGRRAGLSERRLAMAGWEKEMKGFWAVANLSRRFWLNQMNPIVARDLNMTGMGVGKCVERAKKTLLCC